MAAESDVADEVLLATNQQRYVLFPLTFHDVWAKYTQHKENFWTAEDPDLSRDSKPWAELTQDERDFTAAALAVLASTALDNLAERFLVDVQIPEARCFFGFQIAIDNIHAEMLSRLIESYIKGADEKATLLRDAQPVVEMQKAWVARWIKTSAPIGERLVALAAVKGISSAGAHCAFSWLKEQGKMPGLSLCNDLISRDKNAHCEFACLLFQMLANKPSEQTISDIVCSAVTIEKMLVCEAVRGIGIDPFLMSAYIEFVADKLLVMLGLPKLWKVANPFGWMETKIVFVTKPLVKRSKPPVRAEAFAMDADF